MVEVFVLHVSGSSLLLALHIGFPQAPLGVSPVPENLPRITKDDSKPPPSGINL